MNRADTSSRIRCQRGGVERWVLDRMAHTKHSIFAVLFRVDQGATMREIKLTVLCIGDRIDNVHVLMHKSNVELERLHNRRDVVALDAHQRAHTAGVDGARAHPLIDRDGVHQVEVSAAHNDHRHHAPRDHHAREHVFVRKYQKLFSRQHLKRWELTRLRHEAATNSVRGPEQLRARQLVHTQARVAGRK